MKNNKKSSCLNVSQKQYRRDGEGRIIVDMNVKDDTDFLSVFSANDTPVISSEVAEFLENSTHFNLDFNLRTTAPVPGTGACTRAAHPWDRVPFPTIPGAKQPANGASKSLGLVTHFLENII